LAPEYVKKLEDKINDIDDTLLRVYGEYLAIERDHHIVCREYVKKMRAVKELEKARAGQENEPRDPSQRKDRREIILESTAGAGDVESSRGAIIKGVTKGPQRQQSEEPGNTVDSRKIELKTDVTSAKSRTSNLTWSEPASGPLRTKVRDEGESTLSRPSRGTAKHTQSQSRVAPTSKPGLATDRAIHESTSRALPGVTVTRPQNQLWSRPASGQDRTRTQINTGHTMSSSHGVTAKQPQSQQWSEPATKPASRKSKVEAKNPGYDFYRVTAEGEAIKAAERKERRDRIKAKVFGGSSKHG
jgi:hypothetical protein